MEFVEEAFVDVPYVYGIEGFWAIGKNSLPSTKNLWNMYIQ